MKDGLFKVPYLTVLLVRGGGGQARHCNVQRHARAGDDGAGGLKQLTAQAAGELHVGAARGQQLPAPSRTSATSWPRFTAQRLPSPPAAPGAVPVVPVVAPGRHHHHHRLTLVIPLPHPATADGVAQGCTLFRYRLMPSSGPLVAEPSCLRPWSRRRFSRCIDGPGSSDRTKYLNEDERRATLVTAVKGACVIACLQIFTAPRHAVHSPATPRRVQRLQRTARRRNEVALARDQRCV